MTQVAVETQGNDLCGILEGLDMKLERILSRQEAEAKNIEEVKYNLSGLPSHQNFSSGGALACAQPQNSSSSFDPLKD